MMYMRGTRGDYDGWAAAGPARLVLCRSAALFPAIRRCAAPGWRPLSRHRRAAAQRKGTGRKSALRGFPAGGGILGAPPNADFNGARKRAWDFTISTCAPGGGKSAATAFLRRCCPRPYLDVWTHTQALRVTFTGRRATGLIVNRRGAEMTVAARGEILLPGARSTRRKLLELSVIGDGARLQALGCLSSRTCRSWREPAGSPGGLPNLRGAGSRHAFRLFRPDRALWALARTLIWRDGPFSAVTARGGGFLKPIPPLRNPNIHITFVPG